MDEQKQNPEEMGKKREFEVGYGKPPVEHQFKQGDERAGRPKGSYSLKTIIKKLLQDEKIELKDGRSILAGEALMRKVLKEALEGDSQSLKLIWNYIDGMPTQRNENVYPEGIKIEIEHISKNENTSDESI